MPFLTSDFDAREGFEYGPVHEENKHIGNVLERDFVRWNLDYGQRGVAGINSWGAKPLERYMLSPENTYSYTFTLVPLIEQSLNNYLEVTYSNHSK